MQIEELRKDEWLGTNTKDLEVSIAVINGNVGLISNAVIHFDFTLGASRSSCLCHRCWCCPHAGGVGVARVVCVCCLKHIHAGALTRATHVHARRGVLTDTSVCFRSPPPPPVAPCCQAALSRPR